MNTRRRSARAEENPGDIDSNSFDPLYDIKNEPATLFNFFEVDDYTAHDVNTRQRTSNSPGDRVLFQSSVASTSNSSQIHAPIETSKMQNESFKNNAVQRQETQRNFSQASVPNSMDYGNINFHENIKAITEIMLSILERIDNNEKETDRRFTVQNILMNKIIKQNERILQRINDPTWRTQTELDNLLAANITPPPKETVTSIDVPAGPSTKKSTEMKLTNTSRRKKLKKKLKEELVWSSDSDSTTRVSYDTLTKFPLQTQGDIIAMEIALQDKNKFDDVKKMFKRNRGTLEDRFKDMFSDNALRGFVSSKYMGLNSNLMNILKCATKAISNSKFQEQITLYIKRGKSRLRKKEQRARLKRSQESYQIE